MRKAQHKAARGGLLLALALLAASPATGEALPAEPLEIGGEPQFVFDRHVIDNSWALKYKREAVERVFHQPRKFDGNPVIAGHGGYVCVVPPGNEDEQAGVFRMIYQASQSSGTKGEAADYAIAYAESKDGIAWTLPKLGLHEWQGTKDNNIVWLGPPNPRSPKARRRASSPFILDVPEEQKRGHRHLITYRSIDGNHLIGSDDLIHWDAASDRRIWGVHSDTQNAIVHDPVRGEYIMYGRAKHLYRAFGEEMIDTGDSRRVARVTSGELWADWPKEAQNILVPDELDEAAGFNCFYGMPTHYYGGVFWGFLWPFKMNDDIHTELAFSRDGERFDRLPARPKLIERGPEGTPGSWDDGMVFASGWVEVGDEWWIYYAGWDGPHGIRERTPGIGLAKVRKEGFISMRGPASGGVLVTRRLNWPGGPLIVNADASGGELKVRVSDELRKPIPGFDYADCDGFSGDSTAHHVTWKGKSLDEPTGGGRVIRLEFLLKSTDLYTFRAGTK